MTIPRHRNNSMMKQLTKIQPQVRAKASSGLLDPAPNPALWKEDGVDHINVWEDGSSELGPVLSHSSPVSFEHATFGRFSNMQAFWNYIQSVERDDRIRMLSGRHLRQFNKKLTPAKVVNFRAIIMDANYQRVKQYPLIIKGLVESTLPFDCYYIHRESHVRIRPNFFKWLNRGWEEIRAALKENREPDFSFLLDKPGTTIYQFVTPQEPVVKKPMRGHTSCIVHIDDAAFYKVPDTKPT